MFPSGSEPTAQRTMKKDALHPGGQARHMSVNKTNGKGRSLPSKSVCLFVWLGGGGLGFPSKILEPRTSAEY